MPPGGRRTRWLLLPIALLAAAIAGCSAPARTAPGGRRVRAPSPPGFPVSVTDDAGRTLTFAAPPRRIVSLSPAHTETLYSLGAGSRVVAADRYSDYPPEARPKAVLNCWPKPPVERLVALEPDLVLVLVEGEEFLRSMDSLGIPALKFFPESYRRALEEIRILGRILGEEAAARRLVAGIEQRAAAVSRRVAGARRPRVLFELDSSDPARPYVAGGTGIYPDIIRLAGGANVFQEVPRPAVAVSVEQIVARDPQVILTGAAAGSSSAVEAVRRRPGWSRIAAVRNGRVYRIDTHRITRPGPRMAEGLEEVARCLHPERFR